jgi:DNA-binding NtrC family response regulator
MTTALTALLLEDSASDAELLLMALRRGGFEVDHHVVHSEGGMREALGRRSWDIIISDYSMPGFNALKALAVLRESGQDIPFVIISGTIGEENAVEALKMGAHDFMVKGRLSRLVHVVERELREARELDLNQVVLGLERMLRRLMGEDIELSLLLSHMLGKIHADPGPIEQIIMNLVVNARDAMPQGGKVSIESGNVS